MPLLRNDRPRPAPRMRHTSQPAPSIGDQAAEDRHGLIEDRGRTPGPRSGEGSPLGTESAARSALSLHVSPLLLRRNGRPVTVTSHKIPFL